jgi:SAM-dependent methyltransferase
MPPQTSPPPADRANLEHEAEFHDSWADEADVTALDIDAVWAGIGCPEVVWIAAQLGDVSRLRVLDLGSGLGEAAIWFAREGADVTALDISPRMLDVLSEAAARYDVEVQTVVGSASDLSMFDDATFDIVYGANVLHHIDIPACLDHTHRVLCPGGRAAFWDPVKYNPVIEGYRRLAAGVRTDDEHPLRRADLKAMEARFSRVTARGFWLTGLAIFGRFFLIDRIHPSADRYWKLVIDRQEKHRRFLIRSQAIDRRILRIAPPLRWMCWNIAVVLER